MRRFRLFGYGLTLALGMALGLMLPFGRKTGRGGAQPAEGAALRAGLSSFSASNSPGGEIEYLEFPLDCAGFTSSQIAELTGPARWSFPNTTMGQVANALRDCGLSRTELDVLLDSAQWEVEFPGAEKSHSAWVSLDQCRTNYVCVFPNASLVLSLSQSVRQRLYSVLALSELNPGHRYPFSFSPDEFATRLAGSGLPAPKLEGVKRLSYLSEGKVCLADLWALQDGLDTNDVAALFKSLCQTTTLLARLRISSESDLDALTKYWGKGNRTEQIRPLLEGLARTPGGVTVGLSILMPPYARTRLYTARASLAPVGPLPEGLCTALNFFNEQLDPRYLRAEEAMRALRTDYEETKGKPAYGDLVAFSTPEGNIKHVSVYMADDVVFARKRVGALQQWFLAKLADVGERHRLTGATRVAFYRRKSR